MRRVCFLYAEGAIGGVEFDKGDGAWGYNCGKELTRSVLR